MTTVVDVPQFNRMAREGELAEHSRQTTYRVVIILFCLPRITTDCRVIQAAVLGIGNRTLRKAFWKTNQTLIISSGRAKSRLGGDCKEWCK